MARLCRISVRHGRPVVLARITRLMGAALSQNPVFAIPGMTATNVVDDYPLNTNEIRTRAFNKEYERVAPDSDDMRFEAAEPTRVRPVTDSRSPVGIWVSSGPLPSLATTAVFRIYPSVLSCCWYHVQRNREPGLCPGCN